MVSDNFYSFKYTLMLRKNSSISIIIILILTFLFISACNDDDTSPLDTDSDGIADVDDNCPESENADQTDTDGYGIGDVCEDDPATIKVELVWDTPNDPDQSDNSGADMDLHLKELHADWNSVWD